MSHKIVKFDVNEAIYLENSSLVKEEVQDEYYQENKVYISENTITDTININNSEFNDKIKEYETFSVDFIKTEIPSSEVNDRLGINVKMEDGICPVDKQIEFCNELLFCNHCQEFYQDYCTKCRVLVHILNKPYITHNGVRELPKYMLETRESIERLGIFSLKVIPGDVRFGPFTGLNSTGVSLKIKGGRFVVNNDKSGHLNWMQYINPARNIYEQNLFPFQYDDKMYYCSTRRIQEDEELLVYFGEKYEDSLRQNVEMDFVPIEKAEFQDVFGCTFCCLGFSSKEYLTEHKAVYHGEANKMFSVEELAQCPFCKIYMEAKEYFEQHIDYCCETNDRDCTLSSAEIHELQVESRSSEKYKTKRWKRGIYKCTQCKFRTIYHVDFRQHSSDHYQVKMYKCRICQRRYKTKKSLEVHVKKVHADNAGRNVEKYSTRDYIKANIKNLKRSAPSHIKVKQLNRGKYKCANCEFKTYYRTYLERHMKIKHLVKSDYKCAECEYKTNIKTLLKAHVKTKHLKEHDYKCTECEYKTNHKSNLETHIKDLHFKEYDHKCTECEYKTNHKSNLVRHIKTVHLKEHDYQCTECEYKTNIKTHLKIHVKTKHLKEHDYKCAECEYKTNIKALLKAHVKTKHLKQHDYKCLECEYKTNIKTLLKAHVKTKHLQEHDFKCTECEYKTNLKSILHKHIKELHLKEFDYKCTECEYQTNNKSHLGRHIRTIHLREHNYKCTECEYRTNIEAHLKAHVKTKHLKEHDYKCAECEYKTNDVSHLKAHVKTEHLKVYDYKCTECEYKTNDKSNLRRHIRSIHLSKYENKCIECEFKTNYKSCLKAHVKTKHLK